MPMTLTPLPGIPFVQVGDDLAGIIAQSLDRAAITLSDGDILVLAQKIVSKAEGRMVNLASVTPTARAIEVGAVTDKDPRLVELVMSESSQILRAQPGVLIVQHRLGFVCANAGIDHSNVRNTTGTSDEWVLLLPRDPDASACLVRDQLEAAYGVQIGVLIIDSHGRAWRLGTVGLAIGLAGLPGLVDLRGQPDLFDFRLRITEVGAADELAAAASLVMGQAAEGTPVVHARGFPYLLCEASLGDILRPSEKDLFR